MSGAGNTRKRCRVNRRYVVDRKAQLSVALLVLAVLAGIGVLYAAAVYVLLDTELLRDRSVADTRLVLLLVHTGYFVIGGAILFVATILLTHRFVGPAHVLRRAVEKMRQGDFTGRLSLRPSDYHKDLAAELRMLRDLLEARAQPDESEDARAKRAG